MKIFDRRRLLLVLPLMLLLLAACAGQINNPEGWAGGTISDDTLFIGTRNGDVRALDLATGSTKWRFELQGEDGQRGVYGTPVLDGDTLFVGGYDSILYALTPNGELKWQERVGGPIVGSPAVSNGAVLISSTDGSIYAFGQSDRTERWSFETNDRVWSSPAIADDVVYVGSMDKRMYALSLEDGTKLWDFAADGAIVATPVVDGGRVYFGSFDGVFYALDAATGQEVWSFDESSNWIWSKAVVSGNNIYVSSLDGNLYTLDKNTGQKRWMVSTEGPIVGVPVPVLDMLAVPSDDGKLHMVRVSDGSELDSCNLGEAIRTELVEKDGNVYFGANDNSIRALRIKPGGNPDEEWVYFSNEDDPLKPGRAPDC